MGHNNSNTKQNTMIAGNPALSKSDVGRSFSMDNYVNCKQCGSKASANQAQGPELVIRNNYDDVKAFVCWNCGEWLHLHNYR